MEEDIKEFLTQIKKEDIIFSHHFYEKKADDRKYLTEDLIIKSWKTSRTWQKSIQK